MDIQMRPMVGRTEEVRSYPRQQNAGAPQGGYNQGSQGSGGNGGGNFGPKAISFDAPQPSQPQNDTQYTDRKSTHPNSSNYCENRMPYSARKKNRDNNNHDT